MAKKRKTIQSLQEAIEKSLIKTFNDPYFMEDIISDALSEWSESPEFKKQIKAVFNKHFTNVVSDEKLMKKIVITKLTEV